MTINIKLLSTKQWNSKVQWLLTTMQKVDEMIHDLGVQALAHGEQHKDVSRMVQLVQAMGKTNRIAGFLVWMETYSPIRMKRDGTDARLARKPGSRDIIQPWRVEEAQANPFWTLEEADEKIAKPLSIGALLGILNGFTTKIVNVEAGKSTSYELQTDSGVLKNAVNAAIKAVEQIKADAPLNKLNLQVEGEPEANPVPVIIQEDLELPANVTSIEEARVEPELPEVQRTAIG